MSTAVLQTNYNRIFKINLHSIEGRSIVQRRMKKGNKTK